MRIVLLMVLALASSLQMEAAALGCPNCPTSRVVAAIVCGEGVWRNLAVTMAPFVVLGVVVWRLNGIGRSGRES